jgi:hypothetical protein
MTRCFEVSTKRFIQTARNSRTVYTRNDNEYFPCYDVDLYNSIKIGDYIGVDKNGIVVKRIPKEMYLLSELRNKTESVKLKNSD